MASISKNGSNGHHKFTLTVTESYVSGGADNYSNVNFSFVLSPVQNGWDWNYSSTVPVTYTVTINGTSYSGNIMKYNGTSTVTVRSGTQRVPHNSDGSKSISFSFSVSSLSAAYLPGSASASGTMALTKIPRYATVSQSLSSKTETTITMKWTADATVDYIWYSTNNGSSWAGINVADGTSGTYTIDGRSANTAYQIKTRVRRKDSQLTTDSSALSVTTYAYPYANSMPNFTIGNKLTIGIFNPLGRSITINLLGADGSICGTDTISGTSISGYNNSTVQGRLYASIPNAQSGTYRVRVTYGSQISTKTGGTYTINSSVCSPSIGTVSYIDTNSTSVSITGNNQQIVRNQSTVRYTANGLTAKQSATVRSCSVRVNGISYNLTLSGSSATGGNAVIDSGTSVDAVFTVTDSRGLTASKTISVTMLDWSVPSAIITMQRQSNYYSQTDITVDANYAYINGNNQITITYQAKKSGTSTYTISGSLSDNVMSTFVADNDFAWDVEVTLVDSFGGTTTYNLNLSRGLPIIYFDRLKSSVGINCFPKENLSLEINGVNAVRSVITRSLSGALTDLAVNTYTIVPLDLSISSGDKLTPISNGGILIGANVSKILVSAMLSYNKIQSTSSRHIRIIKNSYNADNTLAWSWQTLVQNQPANVEILPILAEVQEGDVIYLLYYTGNSSDEIGGNTYGCRTSLTVETVG